MAHKETEMNEKNTPVHRRISDLAFGWRKRAGNLLARYMATIASELALGRVTLV
jgi:hypothetical protein